MRAPWLAFEKETRLGLEVLAHVGVIVQVITSQIGEHRRVEAHAIDAALRQSMR